jgi:hypothetical protein
VAFSAGTAHAVYYGWALAHMQSVIQIVPLIHQAIQASDATSLRAYSTVVEIIRATSAELPLTSLPPQSDQVEAALADVFLHVSAITQAAQARRWGDAATSATEADAALGRALDTIEAFGPLPDSPQG